MITFIKEEKTKNGELVKLYHSIVSYSKATPLMLRCYANLIELNHNFSKQLSFKNESFLLWAEHNNVPIGGICYNENLDNSSVWINFNFTDDNWRLQNVHFICHLALEELVKQKNIKNIACYVRVTNNSGKKCVEKVGMTAKFFYMHKTI